MNYDFFFEHKKAFLIAGCALAAMVAILVGLRMHAHSAKGKSLFVRPPDSAVADTADGATPSYDYTEAPDHIGERAAVSGTVVRVFTSNSGTTFLDFCRSSSNCPFSAVIFASDASAFGDLSQYERAVTLTGVIRSYQGRAEMVLDSPDQIQ